MVGLARCARSAPSSPSGFAAALAGLPARQWGAADVSVSVPLPDGRAVWLYGDTATGRDTDHLTGFVHSTAIVQDRGCLHVSRAGAQVLPNETATRISWPTAAVALDDRHLLVATAQQQLTGTCAFCFRTVGLHGAVLHVTPAGDVVFDRWLPRWPPWTGRIVWGAGMVRSGTSVVLYGISSGGMARDLFSATASVPAAARGAFRLDQRPIAHEIDPAGVTGWHDARGWHVLTLRGTTLVRLDAPGPAGPFTERPFGAIPAPAPGQLRYLAAAHPEQALTGDALLVTVCSTWVDGRTHPVSAYRPTYVAVPR